MVHMRRRYRMSEINPEIEISDVIAEADMLPEVTTLRGLTADIKAEFDGSGDVEEADNE